MSSLINGRNYEILDLADWFHKLTHLGHDLRQIKNSTFNPRNEDYVTSLGIFAAMPVIALIIVLIIYLISSIVSCLCCSKSKKRKNIRIECKVFIFLFGLVCGLSFIVGLYGDWKIHEGIKTIHNSTKDAVNWFDQIKDETKNVTAVLDVNDVIQDLQRNIKNINDELNGNIPGYDTYLKHTNDILTYLRESKDQLNKANKTITDVDVDSVPNYIIKYGDIFCISVLSVLLVLAIIGLVFTFAICSRCLLGCFTVLAVISLIIGSLLVGTTFAGSVGASDFCYDAKPWIKAEINQASISEYIVDCPINNNIISKYLDEAQDYIEKAIKNIKPFQGLTDFLDKNCGNIPQCQSGRASIEQDLNELTTRLNRMTDLVKNFRGLADCNRINTDLNDALNSICTDVIKGVVMIFFNTIAASFCFALLVFSATFALR